ncbi:hypothetical protein, partial [Streptococcus pneumoniae]|uniref:hypothetical protein n=1 Tax=Streptococcus pneumoniae TaxID=1313 RepID=UPI000B23ED87
MIPLQREIFDKTRFARNSFIKYIILAKGITIETFNPNHSYLSQLDVTYKTPDLMSHFLPPHEVSFTF